MTWYQLHVVRGRAPGGHAPERSAACEPLDLGGPDGLELLRSFVFASGSPFPVFPATRPAASWTGRREALVDGGYSNNVPLRRRRRSARSRPWSSTRPTPDRDAGPRTVGSPP